MDLFQYAKSIVVGIRFQPNFTYTDKHGEIANKFLREVKIFKNHFTGLKNSNFSIALIDKPEIPYNHSLSLTSSDIVFEDVIDDYKIGIDDSKEKLKEIRKNIFVNYKIENIERVGLATKFIIDDVTICKTLFQNLFKINSVKYTRFTQTSLTSKSGVKGVNDYYNTIYDFKDDNSKLEILVDFQHIITPNIQSLSDFNIDNFYKHNFRIINDTVVEWLKNEV